MKHLTWIMLGWYLLLPPWVAPYRFNEKAPFSQWHRGASCEFKSFDACAQYKEEMMAALKAGKVTGKGWTPAIEHWNYVVYWNGRCVEVE